MSQNLQKKICEEHLLKTLFTRLAKSRRNVRMNVLRIDNFTGTVGDSLLKPLTPSSNEYLAKKYLPGVHCNHLGDLEMQLPKKTFRQCLFLILKKKQS